LWLILTGTLPVFDEISSRFINSCLRSRYNLVRSIALHSIVHGKYYSPLGINLMFCCMSSLRLAAGRFFVRFCLA